MQYLSISPDDHQNNLADALVMREAEIYQYDINIENYERMLSALPQGDWPDHLIQYKGKPADQVPDEYDNDVIALNYRDRLRTLLKTEKAERKKSELVYETLKAQLPTEKNALQAAVDAAVVRVKGEK